MSDPGTKPQRLFLVAGEHSGDALGAKLMSALKAKRGADGFTFAGVGGEEMTHEGLASLFPIEDVAVMGPAHIIPALPRLVRRVYQTVAAALAFQPDAVVIIDSPEFTHPIAKRIRKRAPHIPVIDYVCPSVWAWRSGRAPKMARYLDEVLCLLPFEPAALQRLKGPHGTYVGHPLIERLDEIRNVDAAGLRMRLGLAPDRQVLAVLPGSRRSEVDRLISVFGDTVALLKAQGHDFDCVIPAVAHVREKIEAASRTWAANTHIVSGNDKYAAMRTARAALAASGTVTLELALASLPMVVAYKVDESDSGHREAPCHHGHGHSCELGSGRRAALPAIHPAGLYAGKALGSRGRSAHRHARATCPARCPRACAGYTAPAARYAE